MLAAISSLGTYVEHIKVQLEEISNNCMSRQLPQTQSACATAESKSAESSAGTGDQQRANVAKDDLLRGAGVSTELSQMSDLDSSVISVDQEIDEPELTDYLN